MTQTARTPQVSIPPIDERVLLESSPDALEEIFLTSPAGRAPIGPTAGTVILFPGTTVAPVIVSAARAVAWRGKVFAESGGSVVNRVGPFDTRAIHGAVYPDRSWVDGRDCFVIDYSKTSVAARWVRDEIRLVAPGLYLGVVWLRRRRVARFALRLPGTVER